MLIWFVLFPIDINECLTAPCDSNANCNDTYGSFVCTCNDGFIGNGSTCNGKSFLKSHIMVSSTDLFLYSCSDFDECTEDNGGCSMLCNNTFGSFFCDCSLGFELDADKQSCNGRNLCIIISIDCISPTCIVVTDIDECALNISRCVDDAGCMNVNGSYDCICNSGFSGNGFSNCSSNWL